ncbi:cysteine desulfuration protein SufE [Rhodoligotrophos appendicifer]|uniref:SufE family protein n=1 Tax=Rhodoligotrophos appendicifer TaxID=987056 RepID=UPI001184887C|nr:SufE family protein [Rhodoligotrophos appendicifer]
MTQTSQAVDQLAEDFELLDDWEDRYRYLIELGRDLPPLADERRTGETRVHGCASRVWLETRIDRSDPAEPILTFQGDSDAHIVKGLIAVLFRIFSGRSARTILATDPNAIFARLGLDEHLTPQRSNGLASMVARIRTDAQTALA